MTAPRQAADMLAAQAAEIERLTQQRNALGESEARYADLTKRDAQLAALRAELAKVKGERDAARKEPTP